MAGPVEIGLAGDVMLGRNVDERQRDRNPAAVWGDVLGSLRSLDGLFLNLECCVSTRGRPWTRTHRPFHFRAHPDRAIPALRTAGVDAVNLANNHVLDFGENALRDTVDHLDGAGIEHVGAGSTLDDALNPALVSASGIEVAAIGFTDNTPEYAADAGSPGTARIEIDLDDSETRALVEEALSRAEATDPDLLIATLHWGPNMREAPPEPFREFAWDLVDRGVDVVHGHSAHVFQGIEVHEGCPILYDTGDFVDDYAVDDGLRNDRSFLFVLRVADGEPTELRLRPTEIANCAVRRASPAAGDWSRRRMQRLSQPFDTAFERDDDTLVLDLR